MLKLQTTLGSFMVELHTADAPITCDNFLAYASAGFFDGTIFHRVIPDFMIQGGGFTADMTPKKTRASIRNESTNGLKNRRGSLAMARTSDPHSASSQFFVNLKDNAFLDAGRGSAGYAVFGHVMSGLEVVDAIAAVATGKSGHHDDVPLKPVVIESVTLVKA